MSESVRLEVTAEDDVRMVVVIESDDGLCSICLENVQEDRQTLACGHEFHEDCLREWLALQDTCPVCRATLPLFKKTACAVRSSEEASIARDTVMKFFLTKCVILAVILVMTFVNFYLLRFMMDQPIIMGLLERFIAVVVVVVIVDGLILYYAGRNMFWIWNREFI